MLTILILWGNKTEWVPGTQAPLTLCLPKTEISVFQRPTLASQRRRFPSLWRNLCFSHPHVTNYICSHCTMCYTVRKKKCSSFFGIKQYLFGLASLLWQQFKIRLLWAKNAGLGPAHPQKQLAVKVLNSCVAMARFGLRLSCAFQLT